jgi:CheY-like chemotaxis protein
MMGAHPDAHSDNELTSREGSKAVRWRVLVVDDEPSIGRLIRTLLGHHDVVVMSSAEQALGRVREGDSFDVIVCDLMMPTMTGMDLYEHVENERPGLQERFIFITGGAFTERATSFLARIENPRLDKPFAIADLEAAMAQVVAATRAPG